MASSFEDAQAIRGNSENPAPIIFDDEPTRNEAALILIDIEAGPDSSLIQHVRREVGLASSAGQSAPSTPFIVDNTDQTRKSQLTKDYEATINRIIIAAITGRDPDEKAPPPPKIADLLRAAHFGQRINKQKAVGDPGGDQEAKEYNTNLKEEEVCQVRQSSHFQGSSKHIAAKSTGGKTPHASLREEARHRSSQASVQTSQTAQPEPLQVLPSTQNIPIIKKASQYEAMSDGSVSLGGASNRTNQHLKATFPLLTLEEGQAIEQEALDQCKARQKAAPVPLSIAKPREVPAPLTTPAKPKKIGDIKTAARDPTAVKVGTMALETTSQAKRQSEEVFEDFVGEAKSPFSPAPRSRAKKGRVATEASSSAYHDKHTPQELLREVENARRNSHSASDGGQATKSRRVRWELYASPPTTPEVASEDEFENMVSPLSARP